MFFSAIQTTSSALIWSKPIVYYEEREYLSTAITMCGNRQVKTRAEISCDREFLLDTQKCHKR
jgi:hypothetical protein